MLSLALKYQDYTMIYNGPLCGASAPDHHHFQAVPAGRLPMENAIVRAFRERGGVLGHVVSYGTAELFHVDLLTNGVFALRSTSAKDMAKLFYRLIDCMPEVPGQSEPMINLLSFYRDKAYYSIVYMRKAHRSHHYYAQGDENIFMSLGTVDMGGVFIAALEKDYEKVTGKDLEEILEEISI